MMRTSARRAQGAGWLAAPTAVMAVVLAGVTTACGPGPATAPESDPNRELLIVEVTHPTKREPINAGRLYLQMGVAETLLDLDPQGRPIPGLATDWTVSSDGLEWRFTVHPDARFHDGSPVTAVATAQALARAQHQPGPFQGLPIASIIGEHDQVVVRLTSPSVLLLPVLTHFSTVILAPASFDASGRAVDAVGTGPFRIVAITEQEFTVERWDDWRGPAPQIARARYLSAGRVESRALLAESGQADVVFNLDTASLARLRTRPGVTIIDIPSPRTTIVKVNAGHPFFRDRRARLALSLAIDRHGIADGLFDDAQRVAVQLLPRTSNEWPSPDSPLGTDPAEARRLLMELGWTPGPDGILRRDGQRFSVTLQAHSASQELPLVAAAVQQQLRQLGVEARVNIGTVADTPASHRDGTLELALVNRGYLIVPDPTAALLDDFPIGGGIYGAMGWNDDALVAALRTLASGAPAAEVAALRGRVVNTLQGELPVIPVLFNRRTAAINARVQNVTVDPFERTFGLVSMRWKP